MKAFLYGVLLQWKLDLRNKGILITYYVVPLVFFGFMGMIFTSINPMAKDTLLQTMTIFAFTMGSFLGTPIPLVELYSSDIRKAYKVGGIPLWAGAINNFLSAFVHLFITGLIIYVVAPLAFGAKLPANPVFYFLSSAVLLITCLGIGTTLGLYITSTSKLTMVSQLLFLPSLMLSGIMFPTDMLPKALTYVGYAFPATWGFKVMTDSEVKWLLLIPLLALLLITVIINCNKLTRIGID
jgi:ABC-2 type transport system permease protein